MTFQDYISNVYNRADIQYAALEGSTGTVGQFVNDARVHVANLICEIAPFKFGKLKTGTSPFTFASADRFVRIETVVVDPGTYPTNPYIPVRPISAEEWYNVGISLTNPPTSGSPVYKLEGLKVTIAPTPSPNTIRIYYVETPAPLVAMTDVEAEIPYEAVELVIQRTLLTFYEKKGMLQAADMVKEDYDGLMKRFQEEWADANLNQRKNLETKTIIR